MTLLRIENLSKRFDGIRAIDDVSFAVDEGEILAIIGPNGAGKTTIFNLVSRVYASSGGRIEFDGHDVTHMAPHRIAAAGIARTFQNIELFERATVLQNLLVGRHCRNTSGLFAEALRLPGFCRSEVAHRRKAEEVIEFLGIERYRKAPVATLPYGIRKIVELGRALCAEPRLLLLDEPSSGLNPEEAEGIGYWIEDIRNLLGITVVMIEHNMALVAGVSDRVLALSYGRVLATGRCDEVQAHPDVAAAYLGT